MMEDAQTIARRIQLPFPCGCLDAHPAPNGFTVEEYTCETHRAIVAALRQREQEVRAETITDEQITRPPAAATTREGE